MIGKHLKILATVLIFCSSAYIPTATAKTAVDQISGLRAAANEMVKWFDELLVSFDEVGQSAERGYLVDSLADLNSHLFKVEQEKRLLLYELRKTPISRPILLRKVNSLNKQIIDLRKSLEELGPKLRVADRTHSDEVISLLSSALLDRKFFLQDLLTARDEDIPEFYSEAQSAIDALDLAQAKLADVISAMRNANPKTP